MPPNGEITRIVVADDHPVVMLGIRALLKEHGGMHVVGEAGNGRELLAVLASEPCDLLITDFSMPYEDGSGDGLPLLKRLRREHPRLPIIVLTMVHNAALTRGMLAAEVNGLVAKVAMTKELQLAIGAVMNGRTYICESMREHVIDWSPSEGLERAADPASLSQREAEVVRLYAQGLSVTQIAEQLHRSVKTVSQQKNDAMRKLGITSNTQLFEYARTYGLL
ncbi:response regulator transcription factor [Dyella nitratireducens]|uniref:DNA-binding response regulator n=1 Tax=Dyella nitratireducens TaxID=1849580 RepID=A0ABQ1FX31_9GAMM|nr:response regulator transcription factor [Dyella nitratireducens]GGA32066.1 DNA-binding response regulator [Dyella nitratireducens]GLQ42787.1 DNA-binding response regulator [Dyella nitratireducens]